MVSLHLVSIHNDVNTQFVNPSSHRLGASYSTAHESKESTQEDQTKKYDNHAALRLLCIHPLDSTCLDVHGLRASVQESPRTEISIALDNVLLDLLREYGGEFSPLLSHRRRVPSGAARDDALDAGMLEDSS